VVKESQKGNRRGSLNHGGSTEEKIRGGNRTRPPKKKTEKSPTGEKAATLESAQRSRETQKKNTERGGGKK